MAFYVTSQIAGCQPIATSSDPQLHPLGTIVRAVDATLGEGEFIYLKGVASTVVGSIVSYDISFQTALDSSGTATPRPLAIAMSANGAGDFGWYQISGMAVATKADSVSFAAGAAFGAGSGLAVAAVTGLVVRGALVRVVASAKTGVTSVAVVINRPSDSVEAN